MSQEHNTIYFASAFCLPNTSYDVLRRTGEVLHAFAAETGATVHIAEAQHAREITDAIRDITRAEAIQYCGPFPDDEGGREFYSWDVVAKAQVPAHAVDALHSLYNKLRDVHVVPYFRRVSQEVADEAK